MADSPDQIFDKGATSKEDGDVVKIKTSSKAVTNVEFLDKCLTPFMSFSIGYSGLSSIVSCCLLFTYGMSTGGPAVFVWGWVAHAVFTLCTASYLGEMCSAYPLCGSVYVFSTAYSPKPEWAAGLSFITGWFNFLGNLNFDTAVAFGFAQYTSACFNLMSTEGKELST